MNITEALHSEEARNGLRSWGWVWMAYFLLNSAWVWDTVWLVILKRPLPEALHVVSLILAITSGLLAGAVFCRKTWDRGKSLQENLPSLAAGLLTGSAVIYAVPWGMKAWGDYVAESAANDAVNGTAALALLAVVILSAALLFTWAGMAAVVFMRYGIGVRTTGRAAAFMAGTCVKKLPFFLLVTAGFLLTGMLLLKALSGAEVLAARWLPYGFYSRWLLEMLIAAGKAAMVLLLMGAVNIMLHGNEENLRLRLKTENNGRGSYFFPAVCAVLLVVLIVPGLWPNCDVPTQYLRQVETRLARADQMRITGLTGQAAAEYIKCESDLLAMEGLLTGLHDLREKKESSRADELLARAEELRPDSRYVPFFRGLLQSAAAAEYGDLAETARLFMKAGRGKDGVPEAYLWAASSYWQAGEGERAVQAANLAVSRCVYVSGFDGLLTADSERLAQLGKYLQKVKNMLVKRQTHLVLNRAEYGPEPAVLEEAARLADQGKRADLYYQVALLAERVPDAQYMYKYARKFWLARAKAADADKEASDALFASYMFVKSGHPLAAYRLISEVYKKYPDRPDIVGDYVYVLLENRRYEEALRVIGNFSQDLTDDMAYMQAVAELRTDDLQGTASALGMLCRKASDAATGAERIKSIDTYLYRFLLEYLQWQKENPDTAASLRDVLQQDGKTAVVYNYIMALEARKAENYRESNRYLKKVLETSPDLAYPYYFLGVNCSEMAGYLKEDRYPEAETYFLRFLAMHDDSAPGYFCLGNVYKHIGDFERAARAYRKVIALNPRRDNPLYEPWGMYNHAAAELEKYSREGKM